MQKYSLKADKRNITGRKVKSLRSEGLLPANIYGKGVKSLAVKTDLAEFKKVFSEAGETGLVELLVGTKKLPILIHNVQTDPVTDNFIHADFYQVNLKEKVVSQVPVETIGESPAEKNGLGTVVQYIDEIEVEALPADLPDKFEIDVSKLADVDQSVFVKDMTKDKKVEIKSDPEQILVKVEPLREEEEEEPAAPAEGEEAVEGESAEEGKPGEETAGSEEKVAEEEKVQEKDK